MQVGNFIVSHRGHLDVARSGELSIVIQLLARGLELAPLCEQLLDAGVLAHELARSLAVGKKRRIGDLAFELFEAFAFAFDE